MEGESVSVLWWKEVLKVQVLFFIGYEGRGHREGEEPGTQEGTLPPTPQPLHTQKVPTVMDP